MSETVPPKFLNFQTLPIDCIEPNKFNPNVMSEDEYSTLKEGMKQTGPDHVLAVERLIVSPKHVFYNDPAIADNLAVIIDGENRWRAAKELGWKTIRCEIRNVGEDLAKIMCYQRNSVRGSLDPIKEAMLFQAEIDRGLTQERVARAYNVSRPYVATRLRLMTMDATVVAMFHKPKEVFKEAVIETHKRDVEEWERKKAEFEEEHEEGTESYYWHVNAPEEPSDEDLVPRGTLTTSHLEVISTLPQNEQTEMAGGVLSEAWSLRETERRVKQLKEKLAKAERFAKALAKAKRKKCPSCGADPEDFYWRDETQFKCSKCYESWDFMKSRKEVEAEKKALQDQEDQTRSTQMADRFKEARENPKYIRMKETPAELHAKVAPWILKKIKEFTELTKVEIHGKRGEEVIEIDYDDPQSSFRNMNLDLKIGDRKFGFIVEGKDYKTLDAKSRVDLHWSITASHKTREALGKFFAHTVETDEDPDFIAEETQRLSSNPREEECDYVFGGYSSCIATHRENCPSEKQQLCKQAEEAKRMLEEF